MALVESPRGRTSRSDAVTNGYDGSPRRSARNRSASPQLSSGKGQHTHLAHKGNHGSGELENGRSGSPNEASAPAPAAPAAASDPAAAEPANSTKHARPELLLSASALQQQPPQLDDAAAEADQEDSRPSAVGHGHKRAHSESPKCRRQQQRLHELRPAQAADPEPAHAAANAGPWESPFWSSAFASASAQTSSHSDGISHGQPSNSNTQHGAPQLPALKVPAPQLPPEQRLTEADIQQAVSLQGWLPDLVSSPSVRGSPLESQGSLRHWFRSDGSLTSGGSFSLQQVQRRTSQTGNGSSRLGRASSLRLDIQVLEAVLPEQYPNETLEQQEVDTEEAEEHEEDLEGEQVAEAGAGEAESAAARQQGASPQSQLGGARGQGPFKAPLSRSQLAASSSTAGHAGSSPADDHAFFAKIAAWEHELVGMLQAQDTPVSIRAIIAAFKDRILTERDKTEFKALCDKWTSVVEYPPGTKCLQLKSWMRGANLGS